MPSLVGCFDDQTAHGRLIRNAQIRDSEGYYHLPLHRQSVVWVARAHVHPVIAANNMVRADWIRID
jgi:hypothetical protein